MRWSRMIGEHRFTQAVMGILRLPSVVQWNNPPSNFLELAQTQEQL